MAKLMLLLSLVEKYCYFTIHGGFYVSCAEFLIQTCEYVKKV